MNQRQKILAGALVSIVVVVVLFSPSLFPPSQPIDLSEFPDFITSNEDYFVTRIGSVPTINGDTYQLEVNGLVDNPTSFSLVELQALNLTDLPLTVECIGNPKNGKLVSTAVWRGFNVYDLLVSLGMSENATGVRYTAADGYYVSHTLEQLQENGVLGAIYMNGVEIPPVQGFPLRILNPGYYGAKQPAWVTGMEVIDRPLEDYWDDRGWDTSPPMDVDTKIFFPTSYSAVNASENIRIGGSAFGGTRVKLVQYTLDDGATWQDAQIVQQMDADHVWVFWEINTSFANTGEVTLKVRATDIFDNQQQKTDGDFADGHTSWSVLVINVI
jgi:DMSO/TMAO reductase YedYZ molybdopterin-dependent catalytic subunit